MIVQTTLFYTLLAFAMDMSDNSSETSLIATNPSLQNEDQKNEIMDENYSKMNKMFNDKILNKLTKDLKKIKKNYKHKENPNTRDRQIDKLIDLVKMSIENRSRRPLPIEEDKDKIEKLATIKARKYINQFYKDLTKRIKLEFHTNNQDGTRRPKRNVASSGRRGRLNRKKDMNPKISNEYFKDEINSSEDEIIKNRSINNLKDAIYHYIL